MCVGDLVHFSTLFSGQAEVVLFSKWKLGFNNCLIFLCPAQLEGAPLSDALLNNPFVLGPSKLKEGLQMHQDRDVLPSPPTGQEQYVFINPLSVSKYS